MSIERAAQRIASRHTGQVATPYCGYCDEGEPCPDREDARVILDAIKQATEHLEALDAALVRWYAMTPGPEQMPLIAHARAALACLQGDLPT